MRHAIRSYAAHICEKRWVQAPTSRSYEYALHHVLGCYFNRKRLNGLSKF
jgi:hypothetical protein